MKKRKTTNRYTLPNRNGISTAINALKKLTGIKDNTKVLRYAVEFAYMAKSVKVKTK